MPSWSDLVKQKPIAKVKKVRDDLSVKSVATDKSVTLRKRQQGGDNGRKVTVAKGTLGYPPIFFSLL